jgi:RIO-like serine/threonine protein kinase
MIKTRTAIINKTNNNTIIKKYVGTLKQTDAHRRGPKNCVCGSNLETLFNYEIELLSRLKNENHFPQVVTSDPSAYTIEETFCGDTLKNLESKNKLIIPNNWKEQIEEIANSLNKNNIYHNDIAITNVCILDGVIYLIDFGCCQPLDLKLKQNYDGRDNLIDLTNLIKKYV